MLRNLKAEMARQGLTNADIAKVINKSDQKVRKSISGDFSFDINEALAIRNAFFPELPVEYLFANEEASVCADARAVST